MKRRAAIYHLDRRPMYYGCAGTTMAALQYYNPTLADPLAYYASLLSWTFIFDKERGMPLKIPAGQLMQRNLQHLYGITQDEIRRDRFDDLWLAIERLLVQDRVVVVWVDANDIDDSAFHYNRVLGEVELMVICGCDHRSNTLDIIVNPQPRSILMIALHKPERATYSQAVEAQNAEWNYVVCIGNDAVCAQPWGKWNCCM